MLVRVQFSTFIVTHPSFLQFKLDSGIELHLYTDSNGIYSSIQPFLHAQRADGDWMVEKAFETCWAMNEFPHLSFVSREVRFDSVFEALAKEPVIEQIGSCWRLSPDIKDVWLNIEKNLRFMAEVLLRGKLTTLHCNPFPSTFGYI
jgi:hypothetical protein